MSANARSLSIIVPVLNEAGLLRSFLHQLRQRAPNAEIIIVDGGSTDSTAEIARNLSDHLVFAKRGRGAQLNAGARAATAEVFWFLHVDAEIPTGCVDEIALILRDNRAVGGFFRIRLPRDRAVYRLTDSFAHYAGYMLRIRCGDHGFFCRRAAFETVGGFPDVPLMEDVDFFRALRRVGRVRAIHSPLLLNPRRYEKIGPTKLTLAYGLIATLYAAGVPRPMLQSIYRRACLTSSADDSSRSPKTCGWRSSAPSRSRSS